MDAVLKTSSEKEIYITQKSSCEIQELTMNWLVKFEIWAFMSTYLKNW